MKRQLVIYSVVLLIVVDMVGASELLHQHEIIFPEITAIAVGAFLSPKMSWQTSRVRILIFIMICALAGVGIVLFVPGPVWLRLTLAYGIAEVIYLCFACSPWNRKSDISRCNFFLDCPDPWIPHTAGKNKYERKCCLYACESRERRMDRCRHPSGYCIGHCLGSD